MSQSSSALEGKAAGGGLFPRLWTNERRRAPGTIGAARHTRETIDDDRGALPGSAPQLKGFDAIVVPRWLAWTGLSRGAQLLLTRLCSPAARGVRQRCKRCSCGKCKRHKGKYRHDARAPVQRMGRGQGMVKRPLRWFADLLGLRSRRQASNILRELECTPFMWRRHIKPGGLKGGTELEVWLNLERWYRRVPGWQQSSERKRASGIEPSPPKRGRDGEQAAGLEGVRAGGELRRALEAHQEQLLRAFPNRGFPR